MSNKQDHIIRLQIIKSECADFNIAEIDQTDVEKLQQKDLNFDVAINVGSNLEQKWLRLETKIQVRKKQRKSLLFSISAVSIFQTPDIQKVINENNGIIAPEDFMRKVINISVGGARGMLAVKLAETPLSHITLPLLDTGSLKQGKN